MEHHCPHRCASLFFGRNEDNGLRCIYHGWKFDVDGNCLDMPNVPPHQQFSARIKAKAYTTQERQGIVYAYLGTRAELPSLPQLEVLLLPDTEVIVRAHQRECNWLQSLEKAKLTRRTSAFCIPAASAKTRLIRPISIVSAF